MSEFEKLQYACNTNTKLTVPQNVSLELVDGKYIASWDNEYDRSAYYICINAGKGGHYYGYYLTPAIGSANYSYYLLEEKDGRVSYDITDMITEEYLTEGYRGEKVNVTISVQNMVIEEIGSNYYSLEDSEESAFTKAISFSSKEKPLITPKNVILDADTLQLSWDAVPGANRYGFYLRVNGEYDPDNQPGISLPVNEYLSSGRIVVDFESSLRDWMKFENYKAGELEIEVTIKAYTDKATYDNSGYNSELSSFSNLI